MLPSFRYPEVVRSGARQTGLDECAGRPNGYRRDMPTLEVPEVPTPGPEAPEPPGPPGPEIPADPTDPPDVPDPQPAPTPPDVPDPQTV